MTQLPPRTRLGAAVLAIAGGIGSIVGLVLAVVWDQGWDRAAVANLFLASAAALAVAGRTAADPARRSGLVKLTVGGGLNILVWRGLALGWSAYVFDTDSLGAGGFLFGAGIVLVMLSALARPRQAEPVRPAVGRSPAGPAD